MDQRPTRFRLISFALHFARGVIRDPIMRRRAMFATLFAAVLMLIAGMTLLKLVLSPRDHPLWFLLFWAGCGWLTLTALLLALFDALMMRVQSRTARRQLRQMFEEK